MTAASTSSSTLALSVGETVGIFVGGPALLFLAVAALAVVSSRGRAEGAADVPVLQRPRQASQHEAATGTSTARDGQKAVNDGPAERKT